MLLVTSIEMGRILPRLIRRPRDIIAGPVTVPGLPGTRPGFIGGDPAPWTPQAYFAWADRGVEPMPWTEGCDLLLAPNPLPGWETESLLETLGRLQPESPVALYERDLPLLPNVQILGGADEDGWSFPTAAYAMQACRAAVAQAGRGFAEVFLLYPAWRMRALLRGHRRAESRPMRGGSPESRRLLSLILDHRRSLEALQVRADRRIGLPAADRVAVVVAHFDDETLGMGAALGAARDAGAEIRVIWLTDGSAGVPSVSPEESARIRHEEARAALGVLEVDDLHFLDLPETALTSRGPWIKTLEGLLRDFEPDRLHTIWFGDNNADHYEIARILEKAWPKSWLDRQVAVAGLWTPGAPEQMVAMDEATRARKDRMAQCHASQMAVVDYLRGDYGLSTWNAEGTDAPWAEAHLLRSMGEYLGAFRTSGARKRIWL